MIFYILIFLLILGVSLFLAYLSMKDFYELPEGGTYGLFLIRNPKAMTTQTLSEIQRRMQRSDQIISFERLYKGEKSALVIFGPRKILFLFNDFNLLELEDYTKVDRKLVSAWEVKKPTEPPKLSENEQFWVQFVCLAKPSGFRVQMRVVYVSSDSKKKVHPAPNGVGIYKDFKRRSVAPIGRETIEVEVDKLLSFILLQQLP